MANLGAWSNELSASTLSPPAGGALYVSTTGSDAANGNTPATALRTVKEALARTTAGVGGTIRLLAGTYYEDSGSAFRGPNNCWQLNKSGAPGQPLIIEANPGDEGRVIIDGEYVRAGPAFRGSGVPGAVQPYTAASYITIRNIVFVRYNGYGALALGGTVLSPDHPDFNENYYENRGNVSRNVLFDSCVWYDQYSETWGNNNAAVRHDYVENWTIRNCVVIKANETKDGLPFPDRTQAFHGYGQRYLLIENCTTALVGTVLSTKAHWKLKDGTPLTDELEARYNFAYGIAASAGTYVGSKEARSGEQYYHHNIFARSAPSPSYFGLTYSSSIDAYPAVSGLVRFEHNSYIDISGVAGTDSAMVVPNAELLSLYGNIFGVATASIRGVDYAKVGTPIGGGLMASDYNVFDTQNFTLDRPDNTKTWSSLTAWQAATSADANLLHVDNPDQNSVVATQSVNYVSIPEYDCRLRAGSPAIGLLPDGTDAGAYQTGTEVIGARLPWIDLTQFWPECPAWLNPGLQTRGSA